MARKSSYSTKIAQEICDQIAGGKSLVRVCKQKKLTYSTVMRWLEQYEDFREKYAQARELQADYLADELVDIADNEKLHPEARRIRVDARKWKAAKLRPKKYGDKIQQELTGPDGKPLPAAQQNTVILADLQGKSLDELTMLFTEKMKG
jgi:hypothetical protein